MRLKGRTALIAGAGRNNGKAIAERFAGEGANLALIARTMGDELNQVVKECEGMGAKVMSVLADMSKPDDVNRVTAKVLETFGKVDVLVNVLGVRMHKPIWEFDYEEWHRAFAVNCHSTFYLAKAVAPAMMQRKTGSIITLGGVASLTAHEGGGAVSASKHGVYGLIKSLALELGPYGVRANLLALSTIENKRQNPEWYADVSESRERMFASIPLKRKGTYEEVANVALFLASDDSSYVTGDRIVCGGGRYM